MTIDLTGQTDDVIARVLRIVDEARRAEAPKVGQRVEGGRPPSIGRFAQLGWSFPPKVLAETKREIMDTLERKWAECGEDQGNPNES